MKIITPEENRQGLIDDSTLDAINLVDKQLLTDIVKTISIPRHYISEPNNNKFVSEWIYKKFLEYGYQVTFQGKYNNVVAMPKKPYSSYILAGAHYDSVPFSPGADDNASAIASLLGCAKALSESTFNSIPVIFVAFNREEDILLGSRDFVDHHIIPNKIHIRESHILEMVGYTSNYQNIPKELPIKAPEKGDFIGLIANMKSNKLITHILDHAAQYMPDFNVVGLKTYFGMEKLFPVLKRSDHAAFWEAGIPSLMWTDTSEFRNPNYHRITDTPDTLNYHFLTKVTKLLTLRVILYASSSETKY